MLIFNYNLASSIYISSIGAQNSVFTNSFNTIFFPTYFALPEATGNVLEFDFQNLPPNYQLQLRATGYIDPNLAGCVWDYYLVTWAGLYSNYNTISQTYFTLVLNFTGGQGTAQIQIINLVSSNTGACQNMYLN